MFTAYLFIWAIRGSLLLLAGWLVARAIESRSATVSHRVLVSAVGCTLILPLVTVLGPDWHWTKPGWMSAGSDIEEAAAPAATPDAVGENALSPPVDERIELAASSPRTVTPETTFHEIPAAEKSLDEPIEMAATVQPKTSTRVRTSSPTPTIDTIVQTPWTVTDFVVAAWAIVASLLLARLTCSFAVLRSILKRHTVPPETVAQQVERTAQRIGLRRRISVVLSADDVMPMACWLGRWTIVLPGRMQSWPNELQETMLVHELGHIARRDAWADYLVQFACCLLWPNPLSWLAARDVRRLRERACDEWTLQKSSMNARTYAECLLEVVRRCQPARLEFVSAMAGKKDFESRLRWLMSVSQPTAARPVTTALLMLGVVGIGLAVATAEPVEPPKTAQQNNSAESDSPSDVSAMEQPAVIVTKDPAPAAPALSVRGIVRDVSGKPLSGMQVVLRAKVEPGHQYAPAIPHDRDVLARTQTDGDGRFAFSKIGIPPRMIDVLSKLHEGNAGAELVVWGNGKGVVWEPISSFDPTDMEIRLSPEADVSGVVIDEDGKPLDDAELRVVGLMKGTDDLNAFGGDPGDLRLARSEIELRTRSKDGRFVLPNMPHDVRILVHCLGQTGQDGVILVDTGNGTADRVQFRNAARQQMTVHRTPIKATVPRKPWVKIRVVDHDGNPVSGGSVEAIDQNRGYGGAAKVGDDGRAVLTVHTPGVYQVHYGSDPLTPALGVIQSIDIPDGGSPEVEMKLPASRPLIGRVIDGDSGDPVVGAYVVYRLSEDEPDLPHPIGSMVVTNRDGVFLAPITDGVWRLSVRHQINGYFVQTFFAARGNTYQPKDVTVQVEPGEPPPKVVIRIARGLVIQGTVVDAEGRPLPGFPVKAAAQDVPYHSASAVTDADGRFRLSGFSPEVDTRVWTWADNGTAELTIPAGQDQPAEKSRTESATLTLEPGTTLTGRVVRNGRPVPGVKVKLMKAPPQPPGQDWTKFSPLSEATTDENGRYLVTGLHKGDQYQVVIEPAGDAEVRDWNYQSPFSHTLPGEGPETIELPDAKLVSSRQELRGIVVDLDGNPVPGIQVSAMLASGRHLSRPQNGPPPWTKCDENGRFRLTNLPDEPIELMAYRPNPAGGSIRYPTRVRAEMNASDIRIVLDPTLGSGIENLDAK